MIGTSPRSCIVVLLTGAATALHLACASDPGTEAAAAGAAGGGGPSSSSSGAGQAGGGLSAQAGSTAGALATAGAGAGGASVGSSSAGTGSAGTGGVSTGGVDSGGSGGMPLRSPGCSLQPTQQLNSWVERPKLSVNAKDRQWWVWLPDGYDPMRPYPVVFTFHGCGGPNNFIPMQQQTGSDAIVVRGTGGGSNGCWTYGGEGDDVKFFDAMLTALRAQYCVDVSRVFAMGYSSGAWMTNTLECTRGDKLRATGTLSGGVNSGLGTCKGKFARGTVHDLADPTNPFTTQGANKELARVLQQNGCMADAPPIMEPPAPCARYQGCDPGYPVIACMTQGKGHDRQDSLAMDAFWRLFSSL